MEAYQARNPQQAALSRVKHATGISLSNWIFERVRPFVEGQVLEVDSGAGNIATICMQQGIRIEVLSINLFDAEFDERYADLLGVFDTVIALHVAEQMVNNRIVVTNCTKLLKQGGHLLTQLPAYTALYNGLNQGFKRWMQHNQEFINELLRTDYKIIKTRYFILESIFSRLPSNLHTEMPISFQRGNHYNTGVSLFSMANAMGFNQTGLSIIVVGRKR